MARGNSQAPAAKSKPKAKAHKSEKNKQSACSASRQESDIPQELQQQCLNVFQNALKPSEQDATILQEVKGHLYNRDFAIAFGKEEYLRVYASRWSPSRALAYVQILVDVQNQLLKIGSKTEGGAKEHALNTVCIGGGAGAEVMALAGWIMVDTTVLNHFHHIDAIFLDVAAWDSIVQDLHQAIVVPPELSKYASAAAKEANAAMLQPEVYKANFGQIDALSMSSEQTREVFANAELVTLLFTLNELYSNSVPKTQQLLSKLTSTLRAGAHLLVVDSPGSYSTVSINGAEKKYPMQWLLDYTLIGSGKQDVIHEHKWEKLVSDDSRWFRMPEGLKYPIELENMRYQIHLYRRLPEAENKA
ncbi:25S rRNA (uridine(2843)-N(3))-methyltransferase [Fulvia fulva]|uniref:25S rRNA (Uridine(2843)-N(3))-methyltransferase n=1 Tax=Passalora fulva TaxID=5499 RepID=A0A9Q8L811_PASFU|nr:25S rRNA (uridine(2843)-N(3))-methyltransferase [Fulvia fulva]KAK4634487.1 25S rRNA (uridine(2843)-N(3))-methyltransferase [Fulvia fulva]KAK4636640.1 25S rRNA (uridine(2843)-N(3))-methyltransferase [Fulvia fulva]UJO11873.1 25S rRNA (uridine(2843)-N(3))-methyltransferase [Fulvia fulva]WPV08833.1 25S rRNA (uridine(2843)-N(3))-methyltransferase [Fulvia fulva]WPV24680.1 25S rRNA (uridine(2843)-N(3))-methyltransferase [Fulvia fulva]